MGADVIDLDAERIARRGAVRREPEHDPGPAELPPIQPGECVICFVRRAYAVAGCDHTLRIVKRYRDERAPRATALETRLGQVGAFCDCEVLMNAYHVHPSLLARERSLEDGVEYESDPQPPEPFPSCTGVPSRSTQACKLWLRGGRYGYRPRWP